MSESRIRRTKTVCTYCGVGCSFDIWSKDRDILKVAPAEGPTNGISTCVKGKFGWDFVNSHDRLTKPLIREGGKFSKPDGRKALTWWRGGSRRSRRGPGRIPGVHLFLQMHQ